jgi:hypothetical protein
MTSCATPRCWRAAVEGASVCRDCSATAARAERAARIAEARAAMARDQLGLFDDVA